MYCIAKSTTVAQLEGQLRRGALSLQRLWFYLQPTVHTMQKLDYIREQAAGLRGGALINK
jgi:Gamma tubulin complex component N-terminal